MRDVRLCFSSERVFGIFRNFI